MDPTRENAIKRCADPATHVEHPWDEWVALKGRWEKRYCPGQSGIGLYGGLR